jgi:hypothetical protein
MEVLLISCIACYMHQQCPHPSFHKNLLTAAVMLQFTSLKMSALLSAEGSSHRTVLITHCPLWHHIVLLGRRNGRKLCSAVKLSCKCAENSFVLRSVRKAIRQARQDAPCCVCCSIPGGGFSLWAAETLKIKRRNKE